MPFPDALRKRKVAAVRKHLEAGVDPNQKLDDYPIFHGIHAGAEILELLIRHGANVNISDSGGRTPLIYAVHVGPEIVELLIRHGANVNVKDDDGMTPLHVAAMHGYFDVVRLLIEAGAELNPADKFGHTPLFITAAGPSRYASHFALNYGAHFGRTGVVEESEEDRRELSGKRAVIALLESRGAAFSQADRETRKAMGSHSETERLIRHVENSFRAQDLDYHNAVTEISIKYTFLHDAYRQLRSRTNLSRTEKTFVDKFETYERRLRGS